MSKQTITALYDDRAKAQQAVTSLTQIGVPAADVTVSPESARNDMNTGEGAGFWASVDRFFGGPEDRETYREGVRRGGTLVTANVADDHVEKAVDILEKHGSVDFDERETAWRSEGWTGGMGASPVPGQAQPVGLARADAGARPVGTPGMKTEATPDNDGVVQVVEERLNVGKRAVSRGKVRLHTYVVENEVSQDVNLRSENVTIERRPVDRPATALGADPFKERTIEMEETAEEAVVGKTAHVVEEIGIRKDVKDRVETVSDTVRSTKVDIDDGRTDRLKDDRLDRKV